jgi:hypothetical protein
MAAFEGQSCVLSNGSKMPLFGLGTWKIDKAVFSFPRSLFLTILRLWLMLFMIPLWLVFVTWIVLVTMEMKLKLVKESSELSMLALLKEKISGYKTLTPTPHS